MKRGTIEHRKTRRLARTLGVPLYSAVGLLECLWHWCAETCRTGSLAGYEAEDIADSCHWDGDAEKLLAALFDAGWLDQTPAGPLVHDWSEHADSAVHKWLKRRGLTFADGMPPFSRLCHAAGVPESEPVVPMACHVMPPVHHGTTAAQRGMPPGRLPEPVPVPEPVSESLARTCAVGSTSMQPPVDNPPDDTPAPPGTAQPAPPTASPPSQPPAASVPPDPQQRVFDHIPALDGPIAEFQGWWRDLTGHLGPTNPLAFLPFWSGVSDDPAVKPVWESACRDFAMAVISAVAPGPNEFSLHRLRNYVNRAVTTAARTSGRAWQGEGGTRAADATGASNDGRWKEARLAAANAIREARRVFGAGTIPKAEIARIGHVMRDKFGRVKLSSGDAEDAVAAGINWALNERPARLGMAQQADAP